MKRPIVALLGFLMIATGCDSVQAGYVGRMWQPSGFEEELLKPGRYSCTGSCQMYLMETTDQAFDVPMNVLCDDKLNFGFTVTVLVGVNTEDNETLKLAFENLKPADKYTFTVEQLFKTYIGPVVDQEARKVVGKYKTRDIVKQRASIIEEVRAAVTTATDTAILKVKRVTVGNLDFPKIVTDAQEAKAKREVEVQTAVATAAIRKAEADGELALARVEAQRTLLRAKAQADANRILASSVSPQLIMWRQWDVMEDAAGGANNMFLVPYSDAANNGIDTSKWLSPQGLVDAELLKRLQQAQNAADQAQKVAEDAAGAGKTDVPEDWKPVPAEPAEPAP